jgi:hypothetical protein
MSLPAHCALASLRVLIAVALWASLASAGSLDSNRTLSKGEPSAWARVATDSEIEPDSIPTLKESEPGEPLKENDEPVVWDHFLPFFGQKVTDMGFELPRPYGIAFIGYWQKQDLTIKDLTISSGGGPVKNIKFLDFKDPSVSNGSFQLKLDAWLLPFLNIYVLGGGVSGDTEVPLGIEGRDLLDYFDRGDLCGGATEPEFCSRALLSVAEPSYTGWNVGVGTTLVGGWRRYFLALPFSVVWTDVSILDDNVTALNFGPRIGARFELGKFGTLAVYGGATYLHADIDVRGSATLDTSASEIPGIGDKTIIEYTVFQGNEDRWNALAGVNWEIKKKLNLHLEGGFLGSRSNIIASLTYRW